MIAVFMLNVFQLALTAAACWGLWRLWSRWFGAGDRRVAWIAGGGFVLRALTAQALFWISYLRLPIARSMQLGDGFWFFAIDGQWYLGFAIGLAHRGVQAILFPDITYPSHIFVQLLAIAVAAFGGVASVAILLNCAAYLATCAIVVRLQPRAPLHVTLVALAAVAFGPGTILWSLQPLKDTFFQLLIAAAIAAFFCWQELWRGDVRMARVACTAAAMLASTFALGGIRWYFAVILWAASLVFLLLVAWSAQRRAWAFVAGVILFVLLGQAARLGGGTDIPKPVLQFLDARPALSDTTRWVARRRGKFEAQPGATTIVPAAPTVSTRMVGGVAAVFLPRAIGQPLGLVRIGGSRAFWIFAELDTLAFDLVVLFAVVYAARGLRSGRVKITPLFVLLLLVFVLTAGPLCYTVSNFGTLIRMRQMLYVIAAVLPLTMRRC